ncbi:hypothetical protein DPMN_186222 [Dreissena polymorpha]|uniref:Uncharacterized protein n=1 Tax=Dreissena polymorpha TaxID=45954 RepID=A0A9D4DQ28_DREPO|nr:hypothetical protein DPMN_186222 [Dreissena polymorpha]
MSSNSVLYSSVSSSSRSVSSSSSSVSSSSVSSLSSVSRVMCGSSVSSVSSVSSSSVISVFSVSSCGVEKCVWCRVVSVSSSSMSSYVCVYVCCRICRNSVSSSSVYSISVSNVSSMSSSSGSSSSGSSSGVNVWGVMVLGGIDSVGCGVRVSGLMEMAQSGGLCMWLVWCVVYNGVVYCGVVLRGLVVRNVMFVVWCRLCRVVLCRCFLEWCEWSGWCMVLFRVVQCRVCRCGQNGILGIVKSVVCRVSSSGVVKSGGLVRMEWCMMWCILVGCCGVSGVVMSLWCRCTVVYNGGGLFKLVFCILVRCRCCVIWCRVAMWCNIVLLLQLMWYRFRCRLCGGDMYVVWCRVCCDDWCILFSAFQCSPVQSVACSRTRTFCVSSVSVVSRKYRKVWSSLALYENVVSR